MEGWQLKQMQALPLEVKIQKTLQRIQEWYEYFNGQVYISFSGGKDSTVLLHLARQLYPDIEAVFCDTGLEYPEIKDFVKTINNVKWIKPKMFFKDVIEKYGFPVVSKEQSHYIYLVRNSKSEHIKNKHLLGINKDGTKALFVISKKWKYLLNAPFKIGDQCCEVMKKRPFKKYEKESGNKPLIGTMASESVLRQKSYLKNNGCNAFESNRPTSQPLGFWTEQDILQYLKTYNVLYASVYGEIKERERELYLTGCNRTGCMFCMFGVHLEGEPNRFQRMKSTHPKLHEYCIEKLGLGEVLNYINVPYE
jgi:3'-phosphoadenosine 5'-phosphosulfate sulfotransferase (PAPS reductase)/FAD synthetase